MNEMNLASIVSTSGLLTREYIHFCSLLSAEYTNLNTMLIILFSNITLLDFQKGDFEKRDSQDSQIKILDSALF